MSAKHAADFENEICGLFGVDSIKKVVDRNCVALRCWDNYNANIEGIEVNYRQFTLSGWRKKFWKDAKDPLEEAKETLRQSRDRFRARAVECTQKLKTIHNGYKAW